MGRNSLSKRNISSQNNNKGNCANREKNNKTKRESKGPFVKNNFQERKQLLLKIFISSLISFGAIGIFGYYLIGRKVTNQVVFSRVLFHYAEQIKLFANIEKMNIELMKEDPLANLLLTKLRPVQEKVASIRKQTQLYERMQRVPGGPTHFRESTLKELDRIVDEEITDLHNEVVIILNDFLARSNAIEPLYKQLHKSEEFFRTWDFSRSTSVGYIVVTNIRLNVDEEVIEKDPNYIQDILGNVTISEIGEKLYALASLHKNWEDHMKRVDKENVTQKAEIKELRKKILENVSENRKYYTLVQNLTKECWIKLIQMANDKEEVINSKKLPYLRLKSIILGDILSLKTRIQNL